MGFTFVSGDRRPLPIFSRQKLEKKSFTESNMLRKLYFLTMTPAILSLIFWICP
jgi:hypothetical protein